jgi:hypothetical protein
MFRPNLGAFQLGFIPRETSEASNREGIIRRARNSVSSFESSMFCSSHRVQIKEETSDEEEPSYSFCSFPKQKN